VPAALREALRLVAGSRRPLAIAWEPGWRLVPNEAFASLTGRSSLRRPGGLPLRDAYPELAPWLEPLLQRASGQGGWAAAEDQLFCVYRNGYAEEAYLTTSCSRLADDSDRCRGVLVSIDDTTSRVLGARRTAALRAVAGEAFGDGGITESCARVMDALSRHREEIPFALLYLREGDDTVRLVAAAHVTPGGDGCPEVIPLVEAGERPAWPVAEALTRNVTRPVDDLLDRFDPLPAGDWPFAPRCALVVPVTCPGDETPEGVLVTGVSARRAPDAEQRAFVELIVKQIGAVIAGGRVREEAANHAAHQAALRAAAQQRDARRRARLRALKARFAGVLEERTRLAREIHDTLLHGVTAVALELRAVRPHLDPSPTSAEALDRILALAERTSHEARLAVWDMRPCVRSGVDLACDLEGAVRRLVDGSAIDARLTVSGRAKHLTNEQQDVVLRVAQESVANVVRHAGASIVRLRLAYGGSRLVLTVADDGRGFVVANDPQAYAGHWGLVGMRERAQCVGGALQLRSAPGAGTTVRLVIPLRRRTGHGSV
jgi:signal transduction histidine kinase